MLSFPLGLPRGQYAGFRGESKAVAQGIIVALGRKTNKPSALQWNEKQC
jgi:hypothetical protein